MELDILEWFKERFTAEGGFDIVVVLMTGLKGGDF